MTADNVLPFRRPPGKFALSARRMRANWPAELELHAGRSRNRLKCTVADISTAGARVRLMALPDAGSHVLLSIAGNRTIPAEVAWRRNYHIGLRFLEEQGWIAQVQARCPFAWSR
jgi:hypothetical protein